MDVKIARDLLASADRPAEAAPEVPAWFDEDAYLLANPDVAEKVACGEIASAFAHYCYNGWREKRRLCLTDQEPQDRMLRLLPATEGPEPSTELRYNVEAAFLSAAGGVLIVGWLDDRESPLDCIRFLHSEWLFSFSAAGVVRVGRDDVGTELATSRPHAFGFVAFGYLGERLPRLPSTSSVMVRLANGTEATSAVAPRPAGDAEIRDLVLSYLARAEFFGNRQVELIRACSGTVGRHITRYNRQISRDIVKGAWVRRFGTPSAPLRGSLVVCLYGKAEYLFVQNALFSGKPGFDGYEIVWVSNSPELAERLLAEAEIAEAIYGVPQTLVLLPGNAGFGAANNAAVQVARSRRILIVNPDVFPRDPGWARKHADLVAGLPPEQTRLFGVPLHYDDGSLMHGGMYFEFDTGLSVGQYSIDESSLIRVEHYGKGAPAWAEEFTRPRPVPAVTGAFMSADRAWFEALGGFNEEYVFGYYEDADLCLASLQKGTVPWLHDLRLWHLEGKGSVRQPQHEAGSAVNRWLFADRWRDVVMDGLLGPRPTHPALAMPAEPRPLPLPARRRIAPVLRKVGAAR